MPKTRIRRPCSGRNRRKCKRKPQAHRDPNRGPACPRHHPCVSNAPHVSLNRDCDREITIGTSFPGTNRAQRCMRTIGLLSSDSPVVVPTKVCRLFHIPNFSSTCPLVVSRSGSSGHRRIDSFTFVEHTSRPISFMSACTSPFMFFGDILLVNRWRGKRTRRLGRALNHLLPLILLFSHLSNSEFPALHTPRVPMRGASPHAQHSPSVSAASGISPRETCKQRTISTSLRASNAPANVPRRAASSAATSTESWARCISLSARIFIGDAGSVAIVSVFVVVVLHPCLGPLHNERGFGRRRCWWCRHSRTCCVSWLPHRQHGRCSLGVRRSKGDSEKALVPLPLVCRNCQAER